MSHSLQPENDPEKSQDKTHLSSESQSCTRSHPLFFQMAETTVYHSEESSQKHEKKTFVTTSNLPTTSAVMVAGNLITSNYNENSNIPFGENFDLGLESVDKAAGTYTFSSIQLFTVV
jgi:hypothetical protein